MKKHLEYKDEKSHKFWKIEVLENTFTVTYGKIDTNGQSKTKEFETDEKATAEAEKLVKQKIKKGYIEIATQTNMKKLTKAFDIEFSDANNNEGWAYGQAVGIKTIQWPRSRICGLPMAHIWTFLVPKEYRVKGENYVAISLFQADDHVADNIEEVINVIDNKKEIQNTDAQPFWDSLSEYAANKHPMEIYFEDIIGGGWALIWLTQEEFNSNLTELPNEDSSTYPNYEYNGMSCFQQNEPPKYVKLIARENDPNIGKKLEEYPDEEDENAYLDMFSSKGEELNLEEKYWGKTHFGGTAGPIQAMPEFSPFYIEFGEDFGNANMGDGNGQIDLLNNEFDWAC